MPEISSFYGILIYMYISDNQPPHFHGAADKPCGRRLSTLT